MHNNIPFNISPGSDPVHNQPINRTQTNIPRINPQLIQLQTHRLTLLDNLLYEYNRNIRDYQQNIHCMIDAIQNTHINPSQIPIRTRPNAQRNAHRNAQINTPSHATPEQDILSYFFYPLNSGPLNSPLNSPLNTNYNNILSDYQVNRATENIIFNTNNQQNNDDTRCSITMDVFIDGDELLRIKGCGHRFKKNALLEWFNRDSRCPMCRYNLHEYMDQPISSHTDPLIDPLIDPRIDPLIDRLIDQIVDPIVDPFTNPLTDPHDNIIIAADTLTENPYRYSTNNTPMDQATNNRPTSATSNRNMPIYYSSNPLSNLIHNALTNSTNPELGNGLGHGLVLLDELQQNSQLMQNLAQLFTGFGQNTSTTDSSMNDTR